MLDKIYFYFEFVATFGVSYLSGKMPAAFLRNAGPYGSCSLTYEKGERGRLARCFRLPRRSFLLRRGIAETGAKAGRPRRKPLGSL
jgi:hypothetical protein